MKKVLLIFQLVIILIVLSSNLVLSNNSKEEDHFYVHPSSNLCGGKSNYTFYLNISSAIRIHDKITLIFPIGFVYSKPDKLPDRDPCLPPYPDIIIQEDGSIYLTFITHIEFNPKNIQNYSLEVFIPKEVGFQNPSQAGEYRFHFFVGQKIPVMKSFPVMIIRDCISKPVVNVHPAIANQNAQFDIQFYTEDSFTIEENRTVIRINLPKEINMINTQAIEKQILMNDTPVMASFEADKKQISFISPFHCETGNKVLIQIPAECGLITPNKQDFYTLSVVFDDLDWDIPSHLFFISTTLDWIAVSTDTTQANEIASYEILLFSDEVISSQKEKIQIIFPETIHLPVAINPSAILMNGSTASSVLIQENSIFIESETAFLSKGIQEITILKEAGLRNPELNTGVMLGIICNESNSTIWSNTIPISEQATPSTKVLLSKPNEEAISSYLFDLNSLKNRLEIGDKITILIPFQEYFTQIVDQTFVDKGFQIEIKDIKNPEKGKYSLFLIVNGLAESITIEIVPHLPFTVMDRFGGEYGNGDWYVKSPWIDFDILYIDDYKKKPITYVFFNDNEQDKFQAMTLPILLGSGEFVAKCSFFTSGEWGDEEPKSFIVYMDTIFPRFSVDSFPEGNKITVSEPDFLIKGNVKRNTLSYYGNDQSFFDKNLSVNDLPVPVEESNGTFSYTVHLKKGDNTIQVKLADEAGNTTTKTYTITYQTTIEMMIDNQIAIVNGIQYTLPVAPYIQKGNTVVPLRFIGETVEADLNFSVNPTSKEVQAVFCRVDNTTIMLTIDSTIAYVNGKKVDLIISPQIKHNTTVVPLRFLVDVLNFGMKWDNEKKSITIMYPKQI